MATTKTLYRNAVNGRIVTEKFAKAHPDTTEKERRPAPPPPKMKKK